MKPNFRTLAASVLLLTIPNAGFAQEPSYSTGPATPIIEGLIDCGPGTRVSAVGEITSEDGQVRTVPAATRFQTARHAADLYNACDGFEPATLADVDVDVIDLGGNEVFTAFIFADNYFELFVNGQLVAVDPVPFTPFNSNIVKFTAARPVTIAVVGVDWEENLGLGSEAGRGSDYHPGDAGIVMRIEDKDGAVIAVTGEDWKAQAYYVSPLPDRACLVVDGQGRDSSACSTDAVRDGSAVSAAFWDVPQNWTMPDFDDGLWPDAVIFSNETVGVNNKPGYTNFTDVFDANDMDARFIWSSNLVLDNLVLLRTTIERTFPPTQDF